MPPVRWGGPDFAADFRARWIAGAVPRGSVRFTSQESATHVEVLLGDGPAQITGDAGVWELEALFGLPPLPVYSAPNAYVQTIPVLFLGRGVETAVRRLRSLARPHGNRRHRPPLVRVSGVGVHETGLDWVITGLEPGDDVRRIGDAARRERQPYVVTLTHHPAFRALRQSPARANHDRRRAHGHGARAETHTVRAGETLPEIAKQHYHDAGKWRAIAEANEIRDPRHLKVGRKLKLP